MSVAWPRPAVVHQTLHSSHRMLPETEADRPVEPAKEPLWHHDRFQRGGHCGKAWLLHAPADVGYPVMAPCCFTPPNAVSPFPSTLIAQVFPKMKVDPEVRSL